MPSTMMRWIFISGVPSIRRLADQCDRLGLLEHIRSQPAGFHAQDRRKHHFPTLALILDGCRAMGIGPGEFR